VALTPAVTATLVKQGFNVQYEAGAGAEAKFRDEDYVAAGAKIADRKAIFNSGKAFFLLILSQRMLFKNL